MKNNKKYTTGLLIICLLSANIRCQKDPHVPTPKQASVVIPSKKNQTISIQTPYAIKIGVPVNLIASTNAKTTPSYTIITGGDLAVIDQIKHTITGKKLGDITLRVYFPGNDQYLEASQDYKITVTDKNVVMEVITFTRNNDYTPKIGESVNLSKIGTFQFWGDHSKGSKITYAIYETSPQGCATIDNETGQLTFNHAGTFTIIATSNPSNNENSENIYTQSWPTETKITIPKSKGGTIKFNNNLPTKCKIGENLTVQATNSEPKQKLSYAIVYAYPRNCATINQSDGTLTIAHAGSFKVEVSSVYNLDYEDSETITSYTINIDTKPSGTITFNDTSIQGPDKYVSDVDIAKDIAKASITNGRKLKYDIIPVNGPGVATINNNGTLQLNKTGSFQVQVSAVADNDYEQATAIKSKTITINKIDLTLHAATENSNNLGTTHYTMTNKKYYLFDLDNIVKINKDKKQYTNETYPPTLDYDFEYKDSSDEYRYGINTDNTLYMDHGTRDIVEIEAKLHPSLPGNIFYQASPIIFTVKMKNDGILTIEQ